MKPILDTIYLYADGHAALIYGKHDKDAGQIHFVHLHQTLGPRCLFKGRIVFHNTGFMNILKIARAVHAVEPSIENGSDRTRQLGIAVGSIGFTFDTGSEQSQFYISLLPDILSNGLKYQPDMTELWDEANCRVMWNDYHIAKKIPVKAE